MKRHFMTNYEFIKLNEQNQLDALCDKEWFLTNIMVLAVSFSFIYAIEKFFVEVEFLLGICLTNF